DGRRVPAAVARAARDVHADAGVDVVARRSRVLRDERGRARSRERRRSHAPLALGPPQGIQPGADHAEGDRLRAEDPPVRHRRALRPHDRRSRRRVARPPGAREPARPADARGDRPAAALAREGGRLAGAMRRPPPVARVLERVRATPRGHEMFLPGQSVLVAVSGGPDSVCMVESLVRLRRLFRISLEVFHFDHRLREGSPGDAAYVARLSARQSLPLHLRAATSSPRKGESVEAWAREQRHFAIAEVTRETGIDRTAIAHTLDDQAETVLMGLVTGSGIQGMSGIAHVTGTWVNPLLDVTREEILAFCRSLHLRPRTAP